jgi:hypothetical protein
MTQWEYQVELAVHPDAVTQALDSMGEEGWELVSVIYTSDGIDLYLKRPIEDVECEEEDEDEDE